MYFAFTIEALGYMCGIDVPDKDGVSAASHLCELAVHLEKAGMTLTDQLNSIYQKYLKFYSLRAWASFMGWTERHVICTFKNFQQLYAGWPSGHRCKLASVGVRVRIQPKSKLNFWWNQESRHFELKFNFELNFDFEFNFLKLELEQK